MEFLRAEDSDVAAIERWLEDRVKRYEARSLFLPAGETPRALYSHWRVKPPSYLRELRLLQVDDVSTGREKGMFARFFRAELPDWPVVPPETEDKADLAILGLGPNGHVAFHEPGLPRDFRFGEVALEPATAERLGLEPGTLGITYGVGTFVEAKAILLVVKGEGKRGALERLRAGDPSLPATGLAMHPDLTVLTDL